MGSGGLALKNSISNITDLAIATYAPEHIVVKVAEFFSSPKNIAGVLMVARSLAI